MNDLKKAGVKLAEGLAGHSIREVKELVDKAESELRRAAIRHAISTTTIAGAKKELAKFDKNLKNLSMAHAVVTEKRKGVTGFWTLPDIVDNQLHISGLAVTIQPNGSVDTNSSTPLVFTRHALARLWQRSSLDDLQWDKVMSKLSTPCTLHWPIRAAAKHLGHNQFGLPTSDGLLLCAVDAGDSGQTVVKTYLGEPMATRWREYRQVVDSLFKGALVAVARTAGESAHINAQREAVNTALTSLMLGINTEVMTGMIAMYMDEFTDQSFDWLREDTTLEEDETPELNS